MKRRILSMVLTLALALSLLPAPARAADEEITTAEALETAFASSGEVTLGADIELKKALTVKAAADIKLDLNGHTIRTAISGTAITINGGLTITDSGNGGITRLEDTQTVSSNLKSDAVHGGIYRTGGSSYIIDVKTGGKLDIKGGTIANSVAAIQTAIRVLGTMNLSGGGVYADKIAIKVDEDGRSNPWGKLTVSDSAYIFGGNQAIQNWGEVTISGGTIKGCVNTWSHKEWHCGETTITGGTITEYHGTADTDGHTSTGAVVSTKYESGITDTAKVTIKGGTINGTVCSVDGPDPTGELVEENFGITISGGTFSKDVEDFLDTGKETVTDPRTGEYIVVDEGTVAMVTTGEDDKTPSYHPTLEAAIGAAAVGNTVTLLKPYSAPDDVSITKSLTLDLGGKVLTLPSTYYILGVAGKVEVTVRNGTIKQDNRNDSRTKYSALQLKEGAKVTVNNATIDGYNGIAIYDDSSLTVESGTITGENIGITTWGNDKTPPAPTILIKGGTITAKNPDGVGIYLPANGTTKITGGTISGNTGIEIRGGSLTVTGGTVTSKGAATKAEANGSGSTVTGAGIAVSPHAGREVTLVIGEEGADNGNIKVSGPTAVYFADTIESADGKEKIHAEIKSGTFISTTGGSAVADNGKGILAADGDTLQDGDTLKGIITGGIFQAPANTADESVGKYLAEDKEIDTDTGEVKDPNAVVSYNVNISKEIENGTVRADKEKAAEDEEVTLTVTPDTGYELKSLTVTDEDEEEVEVTPGSGNTHTFTMPASDVTVSAIFEEVGGSTLYTVTISDTKNGTVTTDKKEAAEKATVTLTVTPDTGYKLKSLTVTDKDGEEVTVTPSSENTYTFTMPASAVTVTAEYETANSDGTLYKVTISDTKNGTVTADKPEAAEKATVTLTVTPDTGYKLKSLTVTDKDGEEVTVTSSSENTYTFTMPASAVTVTAEFETASGGGTLYKVTISDTKNGTVTADKKEAAAGATVTLTVTPSTGYQLKKDSLTVTDSDKKTVAVTAGSGGKYTFTMPASDVTVAAEFEQGSSSGGPTSTTYRVILYASPSAGGSVIGDGIYTEDQFAVVRAIPASGYRFDCWLESGKIVSTDTIYSFTVTTNRVLIAVFEPVSDNDGPSGGGSGYRINISSAANGTLTASRGTARAGDTVIITAAPNTGYTAGSVTVTDRSGSSVYVRDNGNGTYTFTMPASPVTVSGTFTSTGTPAISADTSASTPAMTFNDVSTANWFYPSVQYVYTRGLMTGDGGPSIFNPHSNMTRVMVWTVLGRIAGADIEGGSTPPWYAKVQEWVIRNDISDGADPTYTVTRQELMTMLWRYMGRPAARADLSRFSDHGEVAAWAEGAMQWAVSTGLIVGEKGRLDPNSNATRCEVATVIMRFCETVKR